MLETLNPEFPRSVEDGERLRVEAGGLFSLVRSSAFFKGLSS